MALKYITTEISEIDGHVYFDGHDLSKVVWMDPVSGGHIVWEREHTEWKGLVFESVNPIGVYLSKTGDPRYGSFANCEYSLDEGVTWHAMPTSQAEAVSFTYMFVRGINPTGWRDQTYLSNTKFSFTNTNKMIAYGSVMSLIDGVGELTEIPHYSGCFEGLFSNCVNIILAPELPATELYESCYMEMFYGCTNLYEIPELPATTLARSCYMEMFSGCESLTSVELNFTTTSQWSCNNMFSSCRSLKSCSPLLPDVVADYAYMGMFFGCGALTDPPEIRASRVMFYGCNLMFYGCTSLTTAPALPAMNLGEACYSEMFQGCTSLTTAPNLPATTLARNCYYGMFEYCTSLVYAPFLIAENSNHAGCYGRMFYGCESLIFILCLLRDDYPSSCCTEWTSGVAENGSFVGYCTTPWTRDVNGIPANWNWYCYDMVEITATCTNGTVTGGGFYNQGDDVVLTVTPNEGYAFKRWTDGNTQNPRTFKALHDASYHAVCEEARSYTIDVGCQHGTVTGSGVYLEGQTCTLTWSNNPGEHYYFIAYTYQDEEYPVWTRYVFDNPYSFTVTRSMTITCLTFAVDEYIKVRWVGSTLTPRLRDETAGEDLQPQSDGYYHVPRYHAYTYVITTPKLPRQPSHFWKFGNFTWEGSDQGSTGSCRISGTIEFICNSAVRNYDVFCETEDTYSGHQYKEIHWI